MQVSLELCFWCFREFGTAVKHRRRGWIILSKHSDHALPYSYSRDNSKSNLVTACNLCNQWKGSRVFDSDDECRAYLEQKWRSKTYEEMSVLPSGVYAEAELAGVLQPEMPKRALAQKPVPGVSELRNDGVIRDQNENSEESLAAVYGINERLRILRKEIASLLDIRDAILGKPERLCLFRQCKKPLGGRKNKNYCSGRCRTREYLERKAEEGAKVTLAA